MCAFLTPPEPPSLVAADERFLGALAARALVRHGRGRESVQRPEVAEPEGRRREQPLECLALEVGVFVTLFSGPDLRGCLGSAEGREPLGDSVPRLTVAAASRDTRFRPVQLDELPGIRIEITLLGALTRLPSDAAQWLDRLEPPRHGIHIRKGRNTGLYLPQVARRLGWSPVELLREVSVKAGLAENGWQDPAAEVFAFTARSFAVPLEGLLGDTP